MKKTTIKMNKKFRLAMMFTVMTMAVITGCGKEAKITASAANMETESEAADSGLSKKTDEWLQSGNYYVRTSRSRYHVITVKRNKKETKSGDNGTFTIALFDEYGNPVRNEYGSNPAAREGIGHFYIQSDGSVSFSCYSGNMDGYGFDWEYMADDLYGQENDKGEFDQVNRGTPEYKTETSESVAESMENEEDDAWMESFKQAVYDCADQDWQALTDRIPEAVWENIAGTTSFDVEEIIRSYQEDSMRNCDFIADMDTWRMEEVKEADEGTLKGFQEMFGLENTTRGVWLDVTFTDVNGNEENADWFSCWEVDGEWICFCIEIG